MTSAAAVTQASGVSQLLNYGGLGLLALLCLIVLGHNAWNLNALVKTADPERIREGRLLLLAQMAVSMVGLLSVGAAAVYLERGKAADALARARVADSQERRAVVLLDPWDNTMPPAFRPKIMVGTGASQERPIKVRCTSGDPTYVTIDFKPYLDHVMSTSIENRGKLIGVTTASVQP